jgi:hypothetical protein
VKTAFLSLTLFMVSIAHAEFGILARIGIGVQDFKSLKVFKTCKFRQDQYSEAYVWYDCKSPEEYITEASYLFFQQKLIGIQVQFKEPTYANTDLYFGDDEGLMLKLREIIRAEINTPPVMKTWADSRSSHPIQSAPPSRMDFPLEAYRSDKSVGSLMYVNETFYNGEIKHIMIGCTLGSRVESLTYLGLVEKAKADAARVEDEKAKSKFDLDSHPAPASLPDQSPKISKAQEDAERAKRQQIEIEKQRALKKKADESAKAARAKKQKEDLWK